MKHNFSRAALIEASAVTVCAAVKFYFFYSKIGMDGLSPLFTAASVVLLCLVFGLFSLILRRPAIGAQKGVYIAASVLMFTDRVYFSYVNRLPQLSALKNAGQLTDISDMILALITFADTLYLLDIPLWMCWSNGIRSRLTSKSKLCGAKPYLALFGAVTILSAAVITVGAAKSDFSPKYLENEIMCYHIKDSMTLIFGEDRGECDARDYILPITDLSDGNYGIAQGRSVIMIQVEALQSFAVGMEYNGQSVTPNLDALMSQDCFNFANHYYQVGGGNTCDAEFSVLNSLYAPEGDAAYIRYETNDYHGLPYILKENGYSGAYAYHGYKGDFWNRDRAYVYQGFDSFDSMKDYVIDDSFNLGLSDRSFFAQTAEKMKELEKPYFAFLITLSSHYPYTIPDEYKTLTLESKDEGTMLGDYLQSIRYFDTCLGEFLDALKANGMYDDSIFVIYGDHYGIPSTDYYCYTRMTELMGCGYYEDIIFKVPFIVSIPGCGKCENIDKVNGHIDVLPTLLYMLGLNNDRAVMFGQNIFTDEENYVCEMMHMGIGSYFSQDTIFSMPQSGIIPNASAIGRTTGDPKNVADCLSVSELMKKRYIDCMTLLDGNDTVLSK